MTDASQTETPWGAANDIGFVLRLAQVAVFNDMIRLLEADDLRPSHYAALSFIQGRPGLDQHRLGLLLNVKKSNLVALVEELCHRGFVSRERQGRSYALTLSPPGQESFHRLRAAVAAHEERISAAIGGEAEREAMIAGLRRLVDNF